MGERRHALAYRVLVGQHEGKKLLGGPRCRWKNKIKLNFQKKGEWRKLDFSGSGQLKVASSCHQG
jgi:hypothetical protein